MSDLLRIDEPAAAPAAPPQWRAFLEMGFRPLYLAGVGWALLSVAIWIFTPALAHGRLGGMAWHAHEMLWGFVATIAAGFLLTAVTNWTGVNPLKGRPLGALCVAWLVARIGFLMTGQTAFMLAALAESLFFFGSAVAVARAIYPKRSKRNYGVPLLLAALGLTNAFFLAAIDRGDIAQAMSHVQAGMLVMAVVAMLVGRRVIPFFAMRAVTGLQIPMHTQSGQWQLGAGALAALFVLLQWAPAAAAALAVAGAITLWQLIAWQPWAVRAKPLLWILYIGYAAIGIGLLVGAAQQLGLVQRAAWSVHTIGVAGFAVLIIGMVTRTALGHLGRALAVDRVIVTSYLLIIVAAALRLVALLPLGSATLVLIVLHLSACAWIGGLGIYLWRFFPMMIRPRPDAPELRAAAPHAARTVSVSLQPRRKR